MQPFDQSKSEIEGYIVSILVEITTGKINRDLKIKCNYIARFELKQCKRCIGRFRNVKRLEAWNEFQSTCGGKKMEIKVERWNLGD